MLDIGWIYDMNLFFPDRSEKNIWGCTHNHLFSSGISDFLEVMLMFFWPLMFFLTGQKNIRVLNGLIGFSGILDFLSPWPDSYRGSLYTGGPKTIGKTGICDQRKTRSPNPYKPCRLLSIMGAFLPKCAKSITNPLVFTVFPYAFSRRTNTMENH